MKGVSLKKLLGAQPTHALKRGLFGVMAAAVPFGCSMTNVPEGTASFSEPAQVAKAATSSPAPRRAAQGKPSNRPPVHLVLLHTNDVHGQLFPIDYGSRSNVGGAARRSTMLKRLGAGKPNVLVLDAGDIWERGPLSKKYHGKPEVLAMNAAGYDLMALGNNEFRAGIPNLQQRMREAQFPMLSANTTLKSTGKPLSKPYVILIRAGLRIGVIGLTAPRTATYEGLGDLEVEDPIDAAERVAKRLAPQTDLIIALSHIGFPLDRVLAEEVPEIDVIVGGDSHTRLVKPYEVRPENAPGKVIPIVQVGEYGVDQGRLDLWVRPGNHPNPLAKFKGELIPATEKYPEDPRVSRVLKPYHPEAGAHRGRLKLVPSW